MTIDRFIRYRRGFKYQLVKSFMCETPVRIEAAIATEFIIVSEDGYMLIKKGYAWNGTSGPVLDQRTTMRAALVHDALYQLMRHGHLDVFQWREPADALFRDMCREDGVYGWLAAIYYYAVRRFGKVAASSRSVKRKLRAP